MARSSLLPVTSEVLAPVWAFVAANKDLELIPIDNGIGADVRYAGGWVYYSLYLPSRVARHIEAGDTTAEEQFGLLQYFALGYDGPQAVIE